MLYLRMSKTRLPLLRFGPHSEVMVDGLIGSAVYRELTPLATRLANEDDAI